MNETYSSTSSSNKLDNFDVSKYNILNISPVCFKNYHLCFHNVKLSKKEEPHIIEDILLDGKSITNYMTYNSIDIQFHFAEYTINGTRN